MNSEKAVLQIISEKIEDYIDSLCLKEDEEFDLNSIHVSVNKEHLEELENDSFASMFCIKYVDEDFENLGVYCSFTGIDIVLDEKVKEITVNNN